MTETFNTSEIVDFHMKVVSRMVKIVVVKSYDGDGCPDGFSGFVPVLPGPTWEGDTCEEAFANTEAGLRELLESYWEDGDPVPWADERDTVREVVVRMDELPPTAWEHVQP